MSSRAAVQNFSALCAGLCLCHWAILILCRYFTVGECFLSAQAAWSSLTPRVRKQGGPGPDWPAEPPTTAVGEEGGNDLWSLSHYLCLSTMFGKLLEHLANTNFLPNQGTISESNLSRCLPGFRSKQSIVSAASSSKIVSVVP